MCVIFTQCAIPSQHPKNHIFNFVSALKMSLPHWTLVEFTCWSYLFSVIKSNYYGITYRQGAIRSQPQCFQPKAFNANKTPNLAHGLLFKYRNRGNARNAPVAG
jgi:hypothetical protein